MTTKEKIKTLKAGIDGLLDKISDKSEPYFCGQAIGLHYVKELIDNTFPELKESKDERIRKAIGVAICGTKATSILEANGSTLPEALDYLEKQKEQAFTHHEIDESLRDAVTHQMEDDGDVDDFVRKGLDDIVLKYAELGARWQKDKVVKFDHDREQKHKIACWKSLGECSDIPDGHYVVGWFRFGDFRLGIMCNGLFVDINGNRAEQPKEVFYIPNADEEFVYAEQRPTKWSKEEEKHLYNAIEAVKYVYDVSAGSSGAQCIEFLKSIPERLNLQPKQEWSEEDENYFDAIIAKLEVTQDDAMLTDNQMDFLKSLPERFNLQPKQEWSEEDEEAITSAIRACRYMIENFENSTKQYEDAIERLKSLRPQPHWKPSEEQMRYLLAVINDPNNIGAKSCYMTIKSLYNDLKKL